MRKRYTVCEANRTLPYVASIVGEVKERYALVRRWGREHNKLAPEQDQERAELKREIQASSRRIQECVRELEAIDVELKDYEKGLVDFPARLDDRAILLCWELGEERIAHWHETSGGYLGRRPIPENQPDWPETLTKLIADG